jgi:hypothetical protein
LGVLHREPFKMLRDAAAKQRRKEGVGASEESLHEVEKFNTISSTFRGEVRFSSMLAEYIHDVPQPSWEMSHPTGRVFEQKAWRK